MKYERIQTGDKFRYMDEAYNEHMGEWECIGNATIGLPCIIQARRPVSEDFTIKEYANAKEGDRIGPFAKGVNMRNLPGNAAQFATFLSAQGIYTHNEYDEKGIYLVVNRKYERGE